MGKEELDNLISGWFASMEQSTEPKYQPAVYAINEWLNEHGIPYTPAEVANEIDDVTATFPITFDKTRLLAILEGKKKTVSYGVITTRLKKFIQDNLNKDSQDYTSRERIENTEIEQPIFEFTTPKDLGITTTYLYSSVANINKKSINKPALLCLHAPDCLENLISAKIFSSNEITYENYLQIVNEFCKIIFRFYEILHARAKNLLAKETILSPIAYNTSSDNNITSKPVHKKSKKLSEFIDKYLDSKVTDGKKRKVLIPELKSHLEIFIEIIGDKNITDYIKDDLREFREILKKLPPNPRKSNKFKNKSLREISEIKHDRTLQPTTINARLTDITAFFNWLESESYIEKNYLKGISIEINEQEIDSRQAFSREDIKTIFTSKKFTAYKNKENPSLYWVCWLAIYTGMRLEEICQLNCSDIYNIDSIWVIDINDNNNDEQNSQNIKKLKTKNAKRIIPVHEHLLKLGFIDYKDKISKSNTRLFPKLQPYGDRKQYGKMISKQFPLLVRSLGITGKKTFHSFRHTFTDVFKRLRLEDSTIFKQIFGHRLDGLASTVYGSKFTPQECYNELISKIDYGLDDERPS